MMDAMLPQLESLQRAMAPYPWAYTALVVAVLLLAAWLANWLTKRVLLRGLRKLIRLSPLVAHMHDGNNVQLRVIPRLANVVPAVVLYHGVSVVPDLEPSVVSVVKVLCEVFIIFTVALAVSRALDLVNEAYEKRADARNKPIKGYLQVAKIVVFVLAGLSIAATVFGVKFLHVVTGLGAATAVLMLVFQDTILSFVASVQISTDGRLRRGDWIEMPSEGVDGEVRDIALHTITVQNWDMTISAVPTKKFISESFRNWRGMSESGGRRIKRALYLDQNSVHFLADDEAERLSRFHLLAPYLQHKRQELEEWNSSSGVRREEPVNQRRMTNLGTFRAYVERYLRAHPGIHQGMTLMVRQLPPAATGLPLEIYCFTNTVQWTAYENIQSDIFDHLLSILPEFGLRVFQEPAGADMRVALGSMSRLQASAAE
ncbi:mechanosensitive ion channel protein MscS [Pseudoxanthomonas kalamensis DSM 18571]|uniref:mechanosensitive ion channel family protein n=1 Tax=Pseudoxanthomonas kalamensis TaxID=289483 RepID=UPI001392045F|nr:mechanosensitive ion channel domain-containing protein [Pseudoxanthomonas kalamensis]KAF1712145.1 mechanosensitive ion channel protein MscS [Pseudoxanthomonas kalamensis DSM 18571]